VDTILRRHLLHELLEQRWVHLDWATGALTVREDLAACFHAEGEKGLVDKLRTVTTLTGEWWLDAVSGTFLARKTAGAFDYDLGSLHPDTIKLAPRLDRIPDERDVADLLSKLGLPPAQRRVAYLDGDLQLEEDKQIHFQVYGAPERLLPDELSALAPGLACYAPQVLRPPSKRALATALPSPPLTPVSAVLTTQPAASYPGNSSAAARSVTQDPLITQVMADMILVPAGSFWMGDDRVPSEAPRHKVTLTRAFWLGRYPVTQELWEKVMGRLPHLERWERGPRFPIIHVGYREMQEFMDRLTALDGGAGFALPTEAEWEYACRAGSTGDYSFGSAQRSTPLPIDDYAWHKGNAEGRLHEVGLKRPNAFGLFDMHGLVYETVRDGRRTYQIEPTTDPVGPIDGRNAVARGGAWTRFPFSGPGRREEEHFRCASRQTYERSKRVGFRILRYPEATQ
jgi:formylglycine-generating enzyme required for sulfatase activity